MSFVEKTFGQADPALARYVDEVFHPEDEALREICERSKKEKLPEIQVNGFDALLLEVITRASGANKAVEIGTLGGYSGLAILRGLSPNGTLYTCEYEPHHADVARESFEKNGFAARAKIYVGPALESLPKIEKEGPFDLVFIDADKANYPAYLDWAAKHLRKGGVVLADNSFGWGRVLAPEKDNEDIRAIDRFNRNLAQSGQFRSTMVPTGEGLAMGVKL